MIKATRVADYRVRLVATVSIAFALAFSAAGFASWRATAKALESSLNARLAETANAKAQALDRLVEGYRTLAKAYGRIIERTLGPKEAVTPAMLDAFREDADLSSLYYGHEDGSLIEGNKWPAPPGYDARTRPWYRTALASPGEAAYSGVYLDLISEQLTVSFAVTVSYPDGRLRGVIGVDLLLSTLAEKAATSVPDAASYVALLDSSGVILAHPDASLLGSRAKDIEGAGSVVDAMLRADGEHIPYGDERGRFAVAARLPGTGWVLALVLDRKEAYASLEALAWTQGGILLMGLVGVLCASWLLARSLASFAAKLEAVLDEKNELLRAKIVEIEQLSATDALTGLANRRCLAAKLDDELLRARRAAAEFSVIMFDVDHFKAINDKHGHEAGDRALMSLATLAKSVLRATDTLGRWGGEEFLVLCPDTGGAGAAKLAQKMRAAIEEGTRGGELALTCSFGWSLAQSDDSPAKLVGRADEGMYRAKSKGRNRVETVEPA
jgi:diguanylate cyclase (GGDEF)-like protein